jgi:Na+/melibiose symporter-like transporter
VGLGLAVTGIVLFAGRALDVVTDPLVGWLSDRKDAAILQRLILIGALIAAPSLILLLSPPADASPLWLLIWSATLYLGWTLIQIPYLSWGARLSPHYHERTRLTASREAAVLIGILLSGSLPALLGLLHLSEASQLAALAWVAVIIGIPAFSVLLKWVPSPVPHAPATSSWRGITQNRLFLRLLGAWFVNGLANGIPAVLFPLYCAYVLDATDQERNLLLALYFISAVIGIPLWLSLSRRIPKHKAWSLAMIITCPAFAMAALLGNDQAHLFALICIVTGLCLGADLALPPSMQADIADWDRLRFRRNRTSGLFSLWNMASKLALALAAVIVLPTLDGLGLQKNNPTDISLTSLAVIYALLPCVFKLIAVTMVKTLPITAARQAAISVRLKRRDLAN